jgi:hypothetical protein
MYIDDEGRRWQSPAKLADDLNSRMSEVDFRRFVVSQMGFVRLHRTAKNLEIELDSRTANPVALTGLLQYIHEAFAASVVFHDRSNPRSISIAWSIADARKYVGGLLASNGTKLRHSFRNIDPRSTVFADKLSAAEDIATSHDVPIPAKLRLFEKLFAGRFTFNTFDTESGEYRIQRCGSELKAIDQFLGESAVGRDYREMTDKAYGTWVAETLKGKTEDRISAHEVDAMFDAQTGVRRYCFTRLLLPMPTASARHLWIATNAC